MSVVKLKIIIFTVQKKKNKRISLIIQAGKLKSMFPNSIIKRIKEEKLEWIGELQPTPLSKKYKVKFIYKRNKGVSAYVIEPKPLERYGDLKSLPHVYSTKEQKLCLYYPGIREWDVTMFYTETIVPWISEWLFYYELWLSTGDWLGGGVHPQIKNEKNEKETA